MEVGYTAWCDPAKVELVRDGALVCLIDSLEGVEIYALHVRGEEWFISATGAAGEPLRPIKREDILAPVVACQGPSIRPTYIGPLSAEPRP